MLLSPTAGNGMGASYMDRLSTPAVSLGIAVAVVVSFFVAPTAWLLALTAAAIAGAFVVALAIRKIGGVNGDVLGAVTVVAGLAVLVIAGV